MIRHHGRIRIFNSEGLYLEAATWALEHFVLLAGTWTKLSAGSSWSDSLGRTTAVQLKPFDTISRLIDPTGAVPPKTSVLGRSEAPSDPNGFPVKTFNIGDPVSNSAGDRISLAVGSILDVRTMQNWVYATGDEIPTGIIPSQTQAFSPDGHHLYLKGAAKQGSHGGGNNAVLDTKSWRDRRPLWRWRRWSSSETGRPSDRDRRGLRLSGSTLRLTVRIIKKRTNSRGNTNVVTNAYRDPQHAGDRR